MKKLFLVATFLILSGCATSNDQTCAGTVTDEISKEQWLKEYDSWIKDRQAHQPQIMTTWFRYHDDLVKKMNSASSLEELTRTTEEAIMARQGICRDLSEAQHDGVWTASQCDPWFKELRLAIGKENIAYIDAQNRLKH